MTRRLVKFLTAAALFAVVVCDTARADEGMWLPWLISRQSARMNALGGRLRADDIYNEKRASLKDAVVMFGNGCTGAMVSGEGLLLTNHHCGYPFIQKLSSVSSDWLTDGFWAMDRTQELPAQGLEVSFLVRVEEVTARVLDGVGEPSVLQDADTTLRRKLLERIAANKKTIVAQATEGTHYNAEVESFYYGNQYYVFVYEVFKDVRLVGAPPSSIGKFGGDTDNWMWPRHTGDFSVFRVYAGKDNRPAAYARDNVPYQPKKFFAVSSKGVKENDFTMIYGYPGRTSQYITSDAVDYILNTSNPSKIALRSQRLEIITAAQEADPAVRLQYASKHAGIANAWKKWQGESLGIERLGTIAKKRAYEAGFQQWAASQPGLEDRYGYLLPRLHDLYAEQADYALAWDYYFEAFSAVELMQFAGRLVAAKTDSARLATAEVFYKDYSPLIDRRIAVRMFEAYLAKVPARFVPRELTEGVRTKGSVAGFVDDLFAGSMLASREGFATGVAADWEAAREADPALKLYAAFKKMYDSEIAPSYIRLANEITSLYTLYVGGMMEREPKRNFFPDANFTMRVSYGQVKGYTSETGVREKSYSTIDEMVAKDNPAIYDYNIPQKLRELYNARDYGRWAVDGTVPVAFIATNHTTGGNSGSPVLNAAGELVGLNFDRTWLSTMSDIEFDPAVCRNITLDARYLLFVIEKLGGAGYLINEMVIK